ncbi:MAG: GNAT family N-acetyltransferase [Chitinophagaceae bacterium]|nr:GNAT family N-acetyltransferase [Chitinophagaceae bacterium]MCW5904902.1 GNAT family N-acetyltransferase [Chitinophagaceae bacterium]
MGKKFVTKALSWFLNKESKFLYFIEKDEKVVGFCGGFVPQFYGDGSSSGMLQHAFKEACWGVVKKPWLLFNTELKKHYPLISRNILKKLKLRKTTAVSKQPDNFVFEKYVSLVVIGVHPSCRGTGIFEQLMKEFDNIAITKNVPIVRLSVKKDNARAIAAYKKMGWNIEEEMNDTYKMNKIL